MQPLELRDQLAASASTFSQLALHDLSEHRPAQALLHAGVGLEHLAKASLAARHPSLIIDRDFDSLLHACDLSNHARGGIHGMRTISLQDSLTRVSRFVPEVGNYVDALKLLVNARNGVAHLGHVDDEDVEDSITTFVRVSDYLLKDATFASEEYWGDFDEVADTRIRDSVHQAERGAAEALASARLAFAARFRDVDVDTQRRIVDALLDNVLTGYEEDLIECPACTSVVKVSGSNEIHWEPEADHDGDDWYISGASPSLRFYPGYLHCRVCGLELDGEDALHAAGIDKSWELENVDPAYFYDPDY